MKLGDYIDTFFIKIIVKPAGKIGGEVMDKARDRYKRWPLGLWLVREKLNFKLTN